MPGLTSLPGQLTPITNGSQIPSGGYPFIFPQFRSDQGSPGPIMSGLGFSTLNGLPPNNASFGAHRVEYYLSGGLVAISPIEVFYQAAVSTHPAGGPPGYDQFHTHGANDPNWPYSQPMDTPNWFFYYDQVWKNQWQIPVVWRNDDGSYYHEGSDHVHVGNFSHGDSTPTRYGAELFAIAPGWPWIQHVGYEDVRGIDTYVRTVTHECVHKRLWDDMQLPGRLDLDPDAAGNPVGDAVPDYLETATTTGLNPARINTTTYGGDTEVFARMCERGLFGNITEDWASDGLNKGNPPPPNATTRTVRTLNAGISASTLTFPNALSYVP